MRRAGISDYDRHPVETGAFALVTKDANGVKIATPNSAARNAGVYAGMRLADARALMPALATQIAEPAADAQALRNLTDWCRRYTPIVGIDGTSGIWLDITGAAHLLGGEDELLADLGWRLHAMGFTNRLGLAETPGAAWAVARFLGADIKHTSARAFSDEVGTGSAQKMRPNQKARALIGFHRIEKRSSAIKKGGVEKTGDVEKKGSLETTAGSRHTSSNARASSRTDRVSQQPRPCNILPGGVLKALAPLPLAALRLDETTLHLLGRFGLKSIGALCAVPRSSLKRRFPATEARQAVLDRLDQALGNRREPFFPLEKIPPYFERLSFAEPILATTSFHLGLEDLLQRLCTRMEHDHKGATRLTFSAYHVDGGVSRIGIATARPSRDVAHLMLLFRERIETLNPGFGIDVLVLSADAIGALSAAQLGLSRSFSAGARQDVAALVDRLSNRLGRQSVQRIIPGASHIPERAEACVTVIQAPRAASTGEPQRTERPGHEAPQHLLCKPPRPFRLLERPEPISVMAEVPDGPPLHFTWRRVAHRVIRAEGPERIAPEWWTGLAAPPERTRDYYRVEDDEGRRFWMFREGLYRNQGGDHAAANGVGRGTASSKENDQNGNDARLPTWHMHGLFA